MSKVTVQCDAGEKKATVNYNDKPFVEFSFSNDGELHITTWDKNGDGIETRVSKPLGNQLIQWLDEVRKVPF